MKYDALFLLTDSVLSTRLREGLDLAFAYASFDKSIVLVFSQDAVHALNSKQSVDAQAPIYNRIKMLSMYDIEDVFYLATNESHLIDYPLIDKAKLEELMHQTREHILL